MNPKGILVFCSNSHAIDPGEGTDLCCYHENKLRFLALQSFLRINLMNRSTLTDQQASIVTVFDTRFLTAPRRKTEEGGVPNFDGH